MDGSKRVLLCDPDSHLGTFYRQQLGQMPIELIQCRGPHALRSAALSAQPDLILINVQQQDGDGFRLCRQLKLNERTVITPVLLLSDSPTGDERQRAQAVGALDLIPRIPSPLFLQSRLNAVLFEFQTTSLHHRLSDQRHTVLVAEDSPSLQQFYEQVLGSMNCEVLLCEDGNSAWQTLQKNPDVDMIIADLYMPRMDGRELCNLIRSHHQFDQIPLIVISTEQEKPVLFDLLNQGANDYIQKPFREEELRARVQAHLRSRHFSKEQFRLNQELIELSALLEDKVEQRTQDLFDANVEAIYKLAVACDLKDLDTADHIARVKEYVETFSSYLGLDERTAREYGYSSMMHDVGKLGIPDAILTKPGPLTEAEWQIMRTHPIKGKEILGDKPFFRHAADIAVAHHERFDGSGYPYGLKGQLIPFSARIVAIVDVYDALRSRRPYKAAWGEEAACNELQRLAGHQLDPHLVNKFLKLSQSGDLNRIRMAHLH